MLILIAIVVLSLVHRVVSTSRMLEY